MTVQFPESDAGAIPTTAIRAALATCGPRESPVDEQIAVLPYEIDDLAGFRIARVSPGTPRRDRRPEDTIENSKQSHLITIGPGRHRTPTIATIRPPGDSAIPGLKEIGSHGAGPMRLGGPPGYEIGADAKDARTDAELTVVQWLRSAGRRIMRWSAITRKDRWAEAVSRASGRCETVSVRASRMAVILGRRWGRDCR